MDRITGSKRSPAFDNKTVALLVHGLVDVSLTWLVASPEKVLGIYIKYIIKLITPFFILSF